MAKNRRPLLIVVALLVVAAVVWFLLSRHAAPTELTLYGNIDLRQVDLPFNDSERVAQVLVQEGDRVTQGQLLARLDTSRLEPMVAQAEANVAAQQAMVERMHRGNRPEEISEARANLQAAQADADNARAQYERMQKLSESSQGRAVSRQDMDTTKAALDTASARLAVSQKALALELAGPRREDVAQQDAQLRADQAQLGLYQQQLKDASLLAPRSGVIRSRVVEPGEMSSPQKTAFTIAITDPKWVRTYVGEGDLGRVREGQKASVAFDSFPNRRFDGWVGFISPVAEFTPKSVETPELRTSLVYELRVFVNDPSDVLRLGMPATVYLPLGASSASTPSYGLPAVPPDRGAPAPDGAP